jgi:hypothetical protein
LFGPLLSFAGLDVCVGRPCPKLRVPAQGGPDPSFK